MRENKIMKRNTVSILVAVFFIIPLVSFAESTLTDSELSKIAVSKKVSTVSNDNSLDKVSSPAKNRDIVRTSSSDTASATNSSNSVISSNKTSLFENFFSSLKSTSSSYSQSGLATTGTSSTGATSYMGNVNSSYGCSMVIRSN